MNVNYQSGIQANPLMSQADYANHLAQFNQPAGQMPMSQLPTMQMDPGQGADLYNQLMGLSHANNQRGQLDFSRQYAPMNDQFLLGAEQARANAGLQGGQYMLGREQANYGKVQDSRNFLLNQLLPGMGMGSLFG